SFNFFPQPPQRSELSSTALPQFGQKPAIAPPPPIAKMCIGIYNENNLARTSVSCPCGHDAHSLPTVSSQPLASAPTGSRSLASFQPASRIGRSQLLVLAFARFLMENSSFPPENSKFPSASYSFAVQP